MKQNSEITSWEVEVFFDGDCPLCRREVSTLKWMDRRNRILFTDIAAEGFRPEAYGKDTNIFMQEIHGRLPDKRWITGVEVFRQLYSAIGFSLVTRLTRLPGISHMLETSYRLFARHRLRLTGRCNSPSKCKVAP